MLRSSAQLSLRPCVNEDCPIEAWREEEDQADGGDREIVCALAVAAAERFYGASAQSLYLALPATPPGHDADATLRRPAGSPAGESRLAFAVEGLDSLAEVIRGAQPAVAMAFELDGQRERRVFGVVQELLRGALG